MAKYYSLRFYKDIVLHNDTSPCEFRSDRFANQREAESMGLILLPSVVEKYGSASGFRVEDEMGTPFFVSRPL